MPTTGEVAWVTVGVASMLVCIILLPLFALFCRHLRGRESQVRRWGQASHLLIPPCYCYLTVWVEMCPCLEPRLEKFLPKDLTKKGETNFVVQTNGVRPKSARLRPSTPDSLNASREEITQPLQSQTSIPHVINDSEPVVQDDVTSRDSSESPIVQIVVASSNEDLQSAVSSRGSSQVLDHGHVNMAMTLNDEDQVDGPVLT